MEKIDKSSTARDFVGNIFGFAPNIYTKVPFWGKLEEHWSASITEKHVKGDVTAYLFNWQNSKYSILLKVVNKDKLTFQGKIICNGKEVGKVYLTQYVNPTGVLLLGEWVEDDQNYNVLLEFINI